MPIIQRNLFPRRPPLKKSNGPSVLRLNDSVNDNRNKAKNNLNSKSSEKILVKLTNSNLFDKREAVIIAQRLADVQKISNKKFLDSSESSDSRYVSKKINFVYLF
jgi:hypothetical protein